MSDGEAVYLEQFVKVAFRVESLLVGLAGLLTVRRVLLRVPLDIGDRASQCGRVTGDEEGPVDAGGDQFGERSMACGDWRHAGRHRLDGDEAERLLPGRWQHDSTGPRDQARALGTAERSHQHHRGPG